MAYFAHPWFLLLLVAIPLLVWRWLRRRRGVIDYSSALLVAGVPAGRSRWVRWAAGGARAGALLLLIAGVAGLRWPDRSTRIPTEGIAIQMAVDVSGSMAERDFEWNNQRISRLEAVKRAFHLFVEGGETANGIAFAGRPNDLIGLVTFATWPESPCPLTLSHSVLLQMLDAEKPRAIPDEARTNIGDAIAWGLHRLQSARHMRRVMVLLSDGEHNVPAPALTPRQAAQLAANEHIVVYAIDAAGASENSDPMASDERRAQAAEIRASAQQTMQAVASITGGRYFRAHDTGSLLTVCQEIDRLERQPIRSFVYRRYQEAYPWLGVVALALWVGVFLLENTRWASVP
jgi:Ca-activated chloride channel family protein